MLLPKMYYSDRYIYIYIYRRRRRRRHHVCSYVCSCSILVKLRTTRGVGIPTVGNDDLPVLGWSVRPLSLHLYRRRFFVFFTSLLLHYHQFDFHLNRELQVEYQAFDHHRPPESVLLYPNLSNSSSWHHRLTPRHLHPCRP